MVFLQPIWSPLLRRCIMGLVIAGILSIVLVFYVHVHYSNIYSASLTGAPLVERYKLFESKEQPIQNNGGNMSIKSLIDLPVNFNYSHTNRSIKYTILWYNPAPWIKQGNSELDMGACEYNNCDVTENKSSLTISAAVIFGITMQNMGRNPPLSQNQRNPDQVWVYYTREAPVYHVFAMDYILGNWNNVLNWSMTNNLDSDVFNPYGTFKTRPRPYTNEPDYGKIYDMKTKMAVWLVSNCESKSRRKEYVAALQSAGLAVDIYGTCGEHGKYYGKISDLVKPYKFYLSMENSICKHYVTEKVIDRYNDDVIMLIRGGADYSQLIPGDTYVDSNMFDNVKSLVQYLHELSSNKSRYIEMLRNKYRYSSQTIGFAYPYAMCNLCNKLNNKHTIKRKSFSNIKEDVAREGRCIRPRDIIIK